MKFSWRQAVVVGTAGLLIGGVVSASAQEAEEPEATEEAAEMQHGRGGPKWLRPGGPALRSESVVPERDGDGYATVRTDKGILQSVDGTSLTIEEEDGTVVEIPTSGDTLIRRDGDEAALGDLQEGDHVHTVRVETDGTEITRAVRALSEEGYAEAESRRAERAAEGRGPGPRGPREIPASPEESST